MLPMVRQEGIEPPTRSLEGCCSIQLSYWRACLGLTGYGRRGLQTIALPSLPLLVKL